MVLMNILSSSVYCESSPSSVVDNEITLYKTSLEELCLYFEIRFYRCDSCTRAPRNDVSVSRRRDSVAVANSLLLADRKKLTCTADFFTWQAASRRLIQLWQTHSTTFLCAFYRLIGPAKQVRLCRVWWSRSLRRKQRLFERWDTGGGGGGVGGVWWQTWESTIH